MISTSKTVAALAALWLCAACTVRTDAEPVSLVGRWQVQEADAAVVTAGDNVVFTFDNGGNVHIQGSCNSGSASYRRSGGSLKFGERMSTMMACEEAWMQTDERVGAAVARTDSYRITGDRLYLTDSGGQVVLKAFRLPEQPR